MKPVKIAQIGIGHNHADATMATLRKFPQYFEVVVVAEGNYTRSVRWGRRIPRKEIILSDYVWTRYPEG